MSPHFLIVLIVFLCNDPSYKISKKVKMVATDEQKKNLRALERRYLSTVFGVEYHPDIQVIPENKSGEYKVNDDININGDYIFQRLYRNESQVTDNDPENLIAHKHFIDKATGKILIGGLGLGETLHEILKKDDVIKIDVVESEKSIIDLVAPFFKDERVQFIHDDIFSYRIDSHYDCIYHSIWSNKKQARAAIPERKKLKEKYGKFCDWLGFSYISPRGGVRKGAGRSPGSTGPIKPEIERRTIKKGIRYKPKEIDIIKHACKLSGRSESEIAVTGALKEAVRIIYNIDDSRLIELINKI